MAISKENKEFIDSLIDYYINESEAYTQIAENFVPEIIESMQEYQRDYEGFKVATQLQHYIDALIESPLVKPDPALFARLETKIQVHISDRSLQYIDQLWKSLSQHFSLKLPLTKFFDHHNYEYNIHVHVHVLILLFFLQLQKFVHLYICSLLRYST